MLNNGKWRNGTTGNDTIDLAWQAPWDVRDNADGGAGDDTIWGNVADNYLWGGDGSDYISASWGNDYVIGGAGSDSLYGDEGDDYIEGNDGDDLLGGDDGNDELLGGSGIDRLYGGNGNDTLDGGSNGDTLYGEAGHDTLYGGSGNDVVYGGSGNDTLSDGGDATGSDEYYGGSGNDDIHSGYGADYLSGGDGDDEMFIYNPAGHLLDPGVQIHGGAGTDTLHLETVSQGAMYGDFVSSWRMSGIERIDIEGSTADGFELSYRDVINLSDTDLVTIDGDSNDSLWLQDFEARDWMAGGTWVQGTTQTSADPNDSFTRYDYRLNGTTHASVSVDTDIDVFFM